jgi:predicted ferric reductase
VTPWPAGRIGGMVGKRVVAAGGIGIAPIFSFLYHK